MSAPALIPATSTPVVDKMVGHLVDVTREVFETMVSWTVELPGRQRRAIAHEYVVKKHSSVQG